MSNLREFPASFRGAGFFVTNASLSGGRKVVLHDYINTDERGAEDLGRKPNDYTFTAIVRETTSKAERQALITALETAGPGLLVHPTLGSMMVVALPYTMTEDLGEVGKVTFQLSFAMARKNLQPSEAPAALPQVSRAALATLASGRAAIGANFSVAKVPLSLYDKAKGQVSGFVATMSKAARAVRSEGLGPLQRLQSGLIRDIDTLLRAPHNLATAMDDVLAAYWAVGADPFTALGLQRALFNFGAADLFPRTAGNIRRAEAQNDNSLTTYIRSGSLAYGMIAGAEARWSNVEQLDAFVADVDRNYADVVEIADDETRANLSQTRTAFKAVLASVRNDIYRIASTSTPAIPLDVLAFNLYGSSGLTPELITLNDITDPSLVEGSVRIFTK